MTTSLLMTVLGSLVGVSFVAGLTTRLLRRAKEVKGLERRLLGLGLALALVLALELVLLRLGLELEPLELELLGLAMALALGLTLGLTRRRRLALGLARRRRQRQPEYVRSAHFLLAIAARLLPPSERARYREEFHAELLDIPRDTHLRHALSLLRGVVILRLRRGPQTQAADAPVGRSTG